MQPHPLTDAVGEVVACTCRHHRCSIRDVPIHTQATLNDTWFRKTAFQTSMSKGAD